MITRIARKVWAEEIT